MKTYKEFIKYIEQNDKKIIGFGTGFMAEEALFNPKIKSRVLLFCDNNKFLQGKRIRIAGDSYEVISPDDLPKHYSDGIIVLITSGHYKEIRKQIQGMLFDSEPEVYDYPILKVLLDPKSEEFFEERILKECLKEYEMVLDQYQIVDDERVQKLNDKEAYIRGTGRKDRPFVLPRTMIMPTTRCNLRCQGCSSLLPLFQNPQDISIDQIIQDCDVFFAAVDECIRLTVGGEPFLYPDLNRILERLIEEPKLLGIMLITNGMKIPDDSLIPLLKNKKVFVEISDYGRLEQMGRTVSFMEKNDVNFKVLSEQTWTDMGGVEKRGRSEEELRFVYLNCDQGRVIKGMYDGRFHTCARSARMFALGAYRSGIDYFALSESSDSEEIRTRLRKMYYSDYADACDYCDLGALPARVIESGIQMNDKIVKSGYTIVKRKEYERLRLQSRVETK